jgi:hypothetical protein
MVWYTGNKAKHAADILSIVLDGGERRSYVEPFVGGGNVICRVPGDQWIKLGADKNPYMVAYLDALGNRGWSPPEELSEAEWNRIKRKPGEYPPALVGFAATGPTFGSQWFNTWRATRRRRTATTSGHRGRQRCATPPASGVAYSLRQSTMD